jgi:hypothetical protein
MHDSRKKCSENMYGIVTMKSPHIPTPFPHPVVLGVEMLPRQALNHLSPPSYY